MTGKEFLQHVLEANQFLESRLEQLQRLQNMAQKVTTIISGTPSISDKSQSRIENALVDVWQESDGIEEAVTEFLNLHRRAVQEISKVTDKNERLILEYRYLARKSWVDISKIMQLSLRYIYSLHGNALKSFEENFELEDKKAQKSTNSILTNTL